MADKDGFDRLGDEFDQAGRMTATFERELSRLQATMGDTGREIGSLTTGFGSGLRRAFDGVVFDVATFLNLGRYHLDFHADLDDYFAAKAGLFTPERARVGLTNVDD